MGGEKEWSVYTGINEISYLHLILKQNDFTSKHLTKVTYVKYDFVEI